jgi:hypothetical protein
MKIGDLRSQKGKIKGRFITTDNTVEHKESRSFTEVVVVEIHRSFLCTACSPLPLSDAAI